MISASRRSATPRAGIDAGLRVGELYTGRRNLGSADAGGGTSTDAVQVRSMWVQGGNTAERSVWTVAYIIAEPCIGTKDTACVDACPVDCIHPKKDTRYEDGRPGFEQVDHPSLILSSVSTAAPVYQSAPFRRSSRWTTFLKSGTPTLRRIPATSKAASSSRTNFEQRNCNERNRIGEHIRSLVRLAHARNARCPPANQVCAFTAVQQPRSDRSSRAPQCRPVAGDLCCADAPPAHYVPSRFVMWLRLVRYCRRVPSHEHQLADSVGHPSADDLRMSSFVHS
jgi:NAD-dependent dihydropyrimidine dehydrogenase PreA subunit